MLRGARQVGKSYLAQWIAGQFINHATINLERQEHKIYLELFKTKSVKEIIEFINIQNGCNLEQGDSCLFIDEIQESPEAIQSLRFFYEDLPGLHVITAGSLLDFTLSTKAISMPVGRIDYLYIYPMSFTEFLIAIGKEQLVSYIQELSFQICPKFDFHDELLKHIKTYMLVGGMPAALEKYIETANFQSAFVEQNTIIETFRDDFKKYASKAEQKYLKLVFDSISLQLGNKFICSRVDSESKSKDIKNALYLLSEARIAKIAYQSSPAVIPLGAGIDHKFFKVNFLDLGLVNRIFNLAVSEINELNFFGAHAGKIAEQFVGQELIATANPSLAAEIYYWAREDKSAAAEIDYLINIDGKNVPIEVKAMHGKRLKSLRQVLDQYPELNGVKISADRLQYKDRIMSLPLYAVSELPRLLNESPQSCQGI